MGTGSAGGLPGAGRLVQGRRPVPAPCQPAQRRSRPAGSGRAAGDCQLYLYLIVSTEVPVTPSRRAALSPLVGFRGGEQPPSDGTLLIVGAAPPPRMPCTTGTPPCTRTPSAT